MTKVLYEEAVTIGVIRVPEFVAQYRVLKTIGKGNFAIVVLAIDEKISEYVAIKMISRKEITMQNIVPYIDNELRLCARFDDPNIVKVKDIVYEEETINIIMEFLVHGDLQNVINRGIFFTYDEQVKIVKRIIQGLDYIHKRGIAHRDLKPENILFDEGFQPKLIDFGLSRERANVLKTFCGTTLYMAPEIINCIPYDGMKADIWSLGIIVHLIGAKSYPFNLCSDFQLIRLVRSNSLNINNLCKGILGDIVERCLQFDPNSRASTEELLKLMEEIEIETGKAPRVAAHRNRSSASSLPHLVVRNNTPLYGICPNSTEKTVPFIVNNKKRRRANMILGSTM